MHKISKYLTAAALLAGAALTAQAQDLPPGEGRETLKRVCTACHDIESIPRLRYSKADWTSLVYSMKDMGADASGAEMDQIIDYLTKNFGKTDDPAAASASAAAPAAKKVNVNKATSSDIQTLGFTAKEADSIVAYRDKNGDYKDASGVAKADGVDPAKVDAAKDKMEF